MDSKKEESSEVDEAAEVDKLRQTNDYFKSLPDSTDQLITCWTEIKELEDDRNIISNYEAGMLVTDYLSYHSTRAQEYIKTYPKLYHDNILFGGRNFIESRGYKYLCMINPILLDNNYGLTLNWTYEDTIERIPYNDIKDIEYPPNLKQYVCKHTVTPTEHIHTNYSFPYENINMLITILEIIRQHYGSKKVYMIILDLYNHTPYSSLLVYMKP